MNAGIYIAVAVAHAGCGRIGFDARGDAAGTRDGADAEPPATDLLVWTSFDEEPATGILNRGTLSTTIACEPSCPALAPGLDDNSFDFDGFADAIRISDRQPLHASAGTIAAWIRPRSLPAENVYSIIAGTLYTTGSSNTWELLLHGETLGVTSLSFGGDVDGGPYNFATWTAGTDQWVHLAGTWDGVMERLYVDGVEIDSDSQFTATYDDHDIIIGADENDVGILSRFFDGRIDEVRFYNRALSAAEVMSLATP